jgi:hypothetical protein
MDSWFKVQRPIGDTIQDNETVNFDQDVKMQENLHVEGLLIVNSEDIPAKVAILEENLEEKTNKLQEKISKLETLIKVQNMTIQELQRKQAEKSIQLPPLPPLPTFSSAFAYSQGPNPFDTSSKNERCKFAYNREYNY